jgi:hypothetical protein
MVALLQYQDYAEDVAENLANSDFCRSLSGDEADMCDNARAIGLAYLSERQDDIYQTLTLGAIGVGSGIALFLISYLRPSWFSHIFVKTAK